MHNQHFKVHFHSVADMSSIDKLADSIKEIAHEFDELLADTKSRINSIAQAEYEDSVRRLAATEADDGVLAQAQTVKSELTQIIANYNTLESQYDQLRQIYTFTEYMKADLRRLRQEIDYL